VSYFIFSGEINPLETFEIKGEEALHILKSRRKQLGDQIVIQDLAQKRFQTEIIQLQNKTIRLKVLKEMPVPSEPDFKIHLLQSLVKDKAMDHLIQKTTELGVSQVTVFTSRFSQRPPCGSDVHKKLLRWRKIAVESCKQSGRLSPPEIVFSGHTFSGSSKADLPDEDNELILLSPEGERPDQVILRTHNNGVRILIGPEGGFQKDEIEIFNARPIRLGPRILRSDTAAITAVGIFQLLYGDFGPLLRSNR